VKAESFGVNKESERHYDRMQCSTRRLIVSAFCRQDLPHGRWRVRAEERAMREQCSWTSIGISSHWSTLSGLVLNHSAYSDTMPAWSAYTPHGPEANTQMRPAPPDDPDAPISLGDMFGHPYPVEHERCGPLSDYESSWTIDRMGPFYGKGGYGWYSAGWPDCGGFRELLAGGQVWVTAFGFAPSDENGKPLGFPPLHIHHMHVSTSQSQGRFFGSKGTLPLFDRPFTHLNVEFDIHGDRQCQPSRGGTDCLIRGFPRGFGVQVTRPMHTFYDVNDVRPLGSPDFKFYTEHAFRWTRAAQRRVRLFTLGIPSNVPTTVTNVSKPGLPFAWHDDYLLRFSGYPTEYVAWSEQKFQFTGTLAHIYWHAHHLYSVDSWILSADAATLGLRKGMFNNGLLAERSFVNITAMHSNVDAAMDYLLDHLEAAQEACLEHPCGIEPMLRCVLNKDRWEQVDGEYFDRFHDPLCDAWPVTNGDVFTMVSFHRQLHDHQIAEKIWMHTVIYAHVV